MKKVFAIILACSLLCSNAGMALNIHFCGGMPVDYQFSFGLADVGCGMEESTAACEGTSQKAEKISKTPCCQDAYQLLQLEEASENNQSSLFKIQTQTFLAVHEVFISHGLSCQEFPLVLFTHYSPPPLLRDVKVLFQVFRI